MIQTIRNTVTSSGFASFPNLIHSLWHGRGPGLGGMNPTGGG